MSGSSRVEEIQEKPPAKRRRLPYLLLVPQYVAVLCPWFYNRVEPSFFGIPFFYWYQVAWIVLGALATAAVYFLVREH